MECGSFSTYWLLYPWFPSLLTLARGRDTLLTWFSASIRTPAPPRFCWHSKSATKLLLENTTHIFLTNIKFCDIIAHFNKIQLLDNTFCFVFKYNINFVSVNFWGKFHELYWGTGTPLHLVNHLMSARERERETERVLRVFFRSDDSYNVALRRVHLPYTHTHTHRSHLSVCVHCFSLSVVVGILVNWLP